MKEKEPKAGKALGQNIKREIELLHSKSKLFSATQEYNSFAQVVPGLLFVNMILRHGLDGAGKLEVGTRDRTL